jgi:hypothetical protein
MGHLPCDIGTFKSLVVNSSGIFCGDMNVAPSSTPVQATGTSTNGIIRVDDVSNAIVELDGLVITGYQEDLFRVSNSSVTVRTIRPSRIDSPFAGIACIGNSNITFSAAPGASLTVLGETVGIGAPRGGNRSCSTLHFLRGDYRVSSTQGPAIGAVSSGQLSRIVVDSGDFHLVGSVGFGSASTKSVLFPYPNGLVTFDFNSTSGDGSVVSAPEVIFNETNLVGSTNATQFANGDFEYDFPTSPQSSFYVQFRNVSKAHNVSGTDLLHIGEINLGGLSRMNLSFHLPGHQTTQLFGGKGFLIASPQGTVRIETADTGTPLLHGDNDPNFVVEVGEAWFPSAFLPPVASATASCVPSTTPVPTPSPAAKSGLSGGQIAGIAVGSVAGVGIAVATVIFCCRKKPCHQREIGTIPVSSVPLLQSFN